MKGILIIGWNHESLDLCDRIKEHPALGYTVRGFITLHDSYPKVEHDNVPLIGNLKSMNSWIKLLNIQEVLIAINPGQYNKLEHVLDVCEKAHINYSIIPDVYDTIYGHVIEDIYNDIFRRKHEFSLRRILNILGAITLMILFFPFFLITSIAIKTDSKGSIFYSQIRLGKEGKPFRINKFRSMVQDAEKQTGPTWARKNDSRITRVGQIMRIARIDELPQLINILKGDMSFIGPRPERPFFIDAFKEQIPLYEKRLAVLPGVTGWAQVKWRYDETIEDVKEKLKYDLYYLENKSLWLDLRILFLTFGTVLLRKGQ